MIKKGKKLGLDVHGVLDSNPKLFIHIAEQYDEVHIITGGSFANPKYNLEDQIAQFAWDYYNEDRKWWTHQFSIYDYLLENGAKTNEELGIASHHPFPDETWNVVKANYCREHGIDLHIDDMHQYLVHFTTPYMLYKDPKRNHRGQFGTNK